VVLCETGLPACHCRRHPRRASAQCAGLVRDGNRAGLGTFLQTHSCQESKAQRAERSAVGTRESVWLSALADLCIRA
jgi:hypothetical protein